MKNGDRRAQVLARIDRPGPLTTDQVADLGVEYLEAKQRLIKAGFPLEDVLIVLAGRKVERHGPTPEAHAPTPKIDADEAETEVLLAKQMLAEKAATEGSHVAWAVALRPGAPPQARERAEAATEEARIQREATRRLQGRLLNLRRARDHAHRQALLDRQEARRPPALKKR